MGSSRRCDGEAAIDYLAGDPEWGRLFFEAALHASRDEAFRIKLQQRYAQMRERMAAVLRARAESGGFDPGVPFDQLATMIFAMANGVAFERFDYTGALEVSERFKLGPYLLPLGLCDGWIRAFTGDVAEGLRRSEQALAAIRAAPTAKYQLPMRTAFAGQVRLVAGDVAGALTLFSDALGLARSNGELF